MRARGHFVRGGGLHAPPPISLPDHGQHRFRVRHLPLGQPRNGDLAGGPDLARFQRALLLLAAQQVVHLLVVDLQVGHHNAPRADRVFRLPGDRRRQWGHGLGASRVGRALGMYLLELEEAEEVGEGELDDARLLLGADDGVGFPSPRGAVRKHSRIDAFEHAWDKVLRGAAVHLLLRALRQRRGTGPTVSLRAANHPMRRAAATSKGKLCGPRARTPGLARIRGATPSRFGGRRRPWRAWRWRPPAPPVTAVCGAAVTAKAMHAQAGRAGALGRIRTLGGLVSTIAGASPSFVGRTRTVTVIRDALSLASEPSSCRGWVIGAACGPVEGTDIRIWRGHR